MVQAKDEGGASRWIVGFGFLVAVASLMCFGMAKPADQSMFDRMMTSSYKEVAWNVNLLRAALGLDVLAILAGIVAVVLNLGTPEGSKQQPLPVLLLVLCVVGLVVIVVTMRG